MMRMLPPVRATLLGAIVLLIGVGSARAQNPNQVKVPFSGSHQSIAGKTIDGYFLYDYREPVDFNGGFPVYGQFSCDTYPRTIYYQVYQNGVATTDTATVSGNPYMIYTNKDTTNKKRFDLSVKHVVSPGVTNDYCVVFPTPYRLHQTQLPGRLQFPGGPNYPGAFAKFVNGAPADVYNITCRAGGCTGPAGPIGMVTMEYVVYVGCVPPQPACLPRRGCFAGLFHHRRSAAVCGP